MHDDGRNDPSWTRWIRDRADALAPPDADVYLVGWGMRPPWDCTLETLAVLDRVDTLFCLPAPPDLPIAGEVVDLSEQYEPGLLRADLYRRLADQVLDAAAEGSVAFATFGSAMVGTAPAHHILRLGAERGLRVHALPGVSCLEALWGDLGTEPFNGVLVWDATAFLVNKAVAPPHVDLLLAGVTVLNLHVTQHQYAPLASQDLEPLRDHLLESFEHDHPAVFASAARGIEPAALELTTIGQLGTSPTDVSSLYVPSDPDWKPPVPAAVGAIRRPVTGFRLDALVAAARGTGSS